MFFSGVSINSQLQPVDIAAPANTVPASSKLEKAQSSGRTATLHYDDWI